MSCFRFTKSCNPGSTWMRDIISKYKLVLLDFFMNNVWGCLKSPLQRCTSLLCQLLGRLLGPRLERGWGGRGRDLFPRDLLSNAYILALLSWSISVAVKAVLSHRGGGSTHSNENTNPTQHCSPLAAISECFFTKAYFTGVAAIHLGWETVNNV